MLGIVDDAVDLVLTGAVLICLALFAASLADARGVEAVAKALLGLGHG